MENLAGHGYPKVQDLVDDEKWFCSSYPFRHKTLLHCVELKAKLFGNWKLGFVAFKVVNFLYCAIFCQYQGS